MVNHLREKIRSHKQDVYIAPDGWSKLNEQLSQSLEYGDKMLAGQMSEQTGLFSPVLMQPKDLNSILMQ